MASWKIRGKQLQRGLGQRSTGSVEELLSSKEKKHYTKALKEMHELVKLESLRMHLSKTDPDTEETDYGVQDDEDEIAVEAASQSYLNSDNDLTADEYVREKSYYTNGYVVKDDEVPSSTRQKKIFKELCSLSKGLQLENDRLKNWELNLKEEETRMSLLKKKLKEYEDSLDKLIQHECQRRCKDFETAFDQRILDVTEESKRTKLSFKVMKQANDTLKKQNSQMEEQNQKLEEKISTMSNRISNLQRRNEILKKEVDEKRSLGDTKEPIKDRSQSDAALEKKLKQMKSEVSSLSDTISTCLDWIAESQLKQHVLALVKSDTNDAFENDVCIEISSEKSFKVIQQLPSVLQYMSSANNQLPFLSFVYWSILLSEFTQRKKAGLPLTAYRRIGEELFRSQILQTSALGIKPTSNSFSKKSKEPMHPISLYQSGLCTRILAELIILKTLGQADILAKVLEALKLDTRKEEGKDVFVSYHGSAVLLSLLNGQHKGLTHLIVDVLMQMTVESPYLDEFLDSLGTQAWIKAFYNLFQNRSTDSSIMEKLSIIVQRLSKIKSNHKLFENIQFSKLVRELVANSDVERPFFTLNLRSILLNLSSKVPVNSSLKKISDKEKENCSD